MLIQVVASTLAGFYPEKSERFSWVNGEHFMTANECQISPSDSRGVLGKDDELHSAL